MSPTDQELIQEIRQGDTEHYGTLVERYQRMLYAIAWSSLGNHDVSEDIVQEAFLQGYRYLPTLRQPGRFASWIAQITRNLCRKFQREQAREQGSLRRWKLEGPGEIARPDVEALDQQPIEETLGDALAQLPEDYREALVLFYMQGRSVRDSAAMLGVSEGALKTRLHRARGLLRERLESSLEKGLERLGPSPDTRRRVMAMLPTLPALSLTPLGSLGLFLLKIFPSVLSLGFLFGYMGWINKHLVANYQPGSEFRARIQWKNFLLMVLTIAPFIVLAGMVSTRWGVEVLFWFLGVFMGIASVFCIHQYRVNRTPFLRASTIGYPVIALGFLAIPLFHLPPYLFMAGFLFLNILIYYSRKSIPMRNDYSLFLRARMDLLETGESEGNPFSITGPLSRDRLLGFARLLGSRYLICDRAWRGNVLRLHLPAVTARPAQMVFALPGRWVGCSWVDISREGQCQARLCEPDRRALERTTRKDVDPVALENRVATAVSRALAAFASGESDTALGVLEVQREEQIFKVAPHKLRSQRILYTVSIIGCILWMAMMAALMLLLPGGSGP